MNSLITYDSFTKIKLIRYLIVWRINDSFVFLPKDVSVEFSHVLGSVIGNRLASRQAAPWRKALAPLDDYFEKRRHTGDRKAIPDVSWPVEAVLFMYPGKATYGRGERVLWELKLFGDAADHGFFLETILPAMEEAGYAAAADGGRSHRIWGHFDIDAVYAAHGAVWAPIVSDGRLDLTCRISASQWAEGLTFEADPAKTFNQLVWITAFDLPDTEADPLSDQTENPSNGGSSPLQVILEALGSRLTALARGRQKAALAKRDLFDDDGDLIFQPAIQEAMKTGLVLGDLKPASAKCPGRFIGKYVFSHIPKEIIPCLELASIIHIGRYSHFGCGTFVLG